MNDTPTDAQLLERVRESDMEGFRLLFERYQPLLFRHVLFQTRRTHDAHDIVQETFISVWSHRTSLKPHLSFAAYLFRISGNLVRDAARARIRHERLEAALPSPAKSAGDDPAEAVEAFLLEENLAAVISRLPEKCRQVFLLSRLEAKTNSEIGALLGISVRTVEHQISHALNVLRKKLGRSRAQGA